MTNSEDPEEQSDLGLYSFVSPISPNTSLVFTVDNILNIIQNILREKYFDISQGLENISSVAGIL